MKENILNREIVEQRGWNKLEFITADMLKEYTEIANGAFLNCLNLTSVVIPNSITRIGRYAFSFCSGLTSVTIGNNVTSIEYSAFCNCYHLTSVTIGNSVTSIGDYAFYCCSRLTSINIPNRVTSIGYRGFDNCSFKPSERYDKQRRLIAYKGFSADMTCRNFQYEESKTYEMTGKIKLCRQGFHACINPLDCLNYYSGKIGKNVVFHEVYLEDVSDKSDDDSKRVARKITIGREITLSEMADIASGRK